MIFSLAPIENFSSIRYWLLLSALCLFKIKRLFLEGALRGRGHTRGITSRRGTQADRHSGSDKTGVRAIPKKDGHGTGNWGDVNDELAGETEPIPQTEVGFFVSCPFQNLESGNSGSRNGWHRTTD